MYLLEFFSPAVESSLVDVVPYSNGTPGKILKKFNLDLPQLVKFWFNYTFFLSFFFGIKEVETTSLNGKKFSKASKNWTLNIMNECVMNDVESFLIQITNTNTKESPRPSTLESNLDFLVYRGGRTVSATPTILWKERTIDHILRAFLTFRNHANTLYRTDCLNGKNTSSDFNMIQPGFGGTECSKTAFYRWFLSIFK